MSYRTYVVASVLVLVGASTPSVSAGDDAAAKGVQIGTVIASAIDTALPGVNKLATALVDIFKPKTADVDKNKEAVAKAVATTQAAISQAIKDQVKGIAPLTVQLDTLGPFLQYGFRASNELSALMAIVAANPTLTQTTWQQDVKPRWAKIKGALDAIPYGANDVQTKVKSEAVQQLLLQILEAKSTTSKAIDVLVANSTQAGLARELAELDATLATLHVVAQIQIRGLANGVDSLVKWSNGLTEAQGGPEELPAALREDQKTATGILNRAAKNRS